MTLNELILQLGQKKNLVWDWTYLDVHGICGYCFDGHLLFIQKHVR